jgi:anti-sigma factor RsiW
MKQFEITEAQEWQLFELLEGNLSADESALLHQEIEAQPALAYHFNLLKQTYTSAPEIHRRGRSYCFAFIVETNFYFD